MSGDAPTISPLNDGGVTPMIVIRVPWTTNRTPDHRRIIVEAARPIAVTDRDDRRAAWCLIFAAVEHASSDGTNAEHREVVARDESAARVFEFAVRAVDTHIETAGAAASPARR